MSVENQPVIGYVLKMYPRFSETFIVSEILAREAAGERIVIFSLRPPVDPRFHPELARVEAPVVYVDRPSSSSRLWAQLAKASQDPVLENGVAAHLAELCRHSHDEAVQAISLAAAARARGVTHLHAHFASVATSVARLSGRLAGLPYSFTAHAKDLFHQDVDPLALERMLRDAHHAVTISRHNLDFLRSRFSHATERLHLVHNGLELDRFPYVERRKQAGPRRLLAVGRLVEKKGFGLLLQAVARLHDELDLRVDIVGDGPLRPALERQIEELGLAGITHLRGPMPQQDVAALMGSHDALVAPFVVGSDGNADGLPTVLLEAMARGLPCVAADVTGVGEVVRAGETGWLVPTGDVTALTEAVRDVLSCDVARVTRVTRQARSLVESTFESTDQARRLAALVTGRQVAREVA